MYILNMWPAIYKISCFHACTRIEFVKKSVMPPKSEMKNFVFALFEERNRVLIGGQQLTFGVSYTKHGLCHWSTKVRGPTPLKPPNRICWKFNNCGHRLVLPEEQIWTYIRFVLDVFALSRKLLHLFINKWRSLAIRQVICMYILQRFFLEGVLAWTCYVMLMIDHFTLCRLAW